MSIMESSHKHLLKITLSLTAGFLIGCASTPETEMAVTSTPPMMHKTVAPITSSQPPPRLATKHPNMYVVKRGDTLWDISSMFLRDPWLWPEIWYVNPDIENPHLIYPGDELVLLYNNGRPEIHLSASSVSGRNSIDRLSPQIRISSIDDAIPTIPRSAIAQFLSNPQVVGTKEYERAPYVMSPASDEKLMVGANEAVYVRGTKKGPALVIGPYIMLRADSKLKDPETGDKLGYNTLYLGRVNVVDNGDPAKSLVVESTREILGGDRLFPTPVYNASLSFIPHAPENSLSGQIIAVYDGVVEIAQYNIVVINKGKQDGAEEGHVLKIYQSGRKTRDPITNRNVILPDMEAGEIMIFGVEDRISYGLVMRATRPIHLYDRVAAP